MPSPRLKASRLLCLPALLLALLPAPAAVAQARDATPSGGELRNEYPLRSSPSPTDATAEPSPTVTAKPSGAPSSQTSLQLAMAAVVAILAFAAGFALVLRPFRGRPGRDADPVAVAPTNGVRPQSASRHSWTAEIQWCADEGEAHFRVIARPDQGDGWSIVAESPPLEWPPSGAEAVAALTAAAEDLETRLVAAGWRPLSPGDAWYAKRFAWEQASSRGRFDRRPAGPEATDRGHEPISTPRGTTR